MPGRDEEDQGENRPKQACSGLFARHSLLASSGANLSSGGLACRCYVVFLWCYVCFVFDSHTQLPNNCLRFFLFWGEMSLFPSTFVPLPFSFCMESVCVFSSYEFWKSGSLYVPAGATQDFSSTFLLRCMPLFFLREPRSRILCTND